MAVTAEHKPTFFEQAEVFARKYRNILIGAGAAVLLLVAYKLYNRYTLNKKQKEAAEKVVNAQFWYNRGLDTLALEGDGISPGLLEIVDKYGKTRSGNLANFLAGSIYLRRSDYPNAIKHLKAFKPKSENLGAHARVLLGHAYAQAGDSAKAAESYLAACDLTDNTTLTPAYLKIAGDYHLVLRQYEKAIELFERIRDDYPTSPEARDIDRAIAYARQKQL